MACWLDMPAGIPLYGDPVRGVACDAEYGREAKMPQSLRIQRLYVEPALPKWWDRLIILLTVCTLAVIVVDFALDPTSRASIILGWVDLVFCVLFLFDFGWRFTKAPRKGAFLRRNWIDLLGAIPFVGPLRSARLVRLMRLVRLTRVVVLTRRVTRHFQFAVPSKALGYLGLAAVLWWLFAGMTFSMFERGNNDNIKGVDDALWWSITTLSTVGYGDLYPITPGGRVVAAATMALGVGILGTFGGTIATMFLDFREQGRKGLRALSAKDHLLVLGWNEKARTAISEFCSDPRYVDTKIIIVADLEENPIDDGKVGFVRGLPCSSETLRKADAARAGAAIVLAENPSDPHSDHQSALTVMGLRRLNKKIRISAELVCVDNREHLDAAGCDAVIDALSVASGLLVRGVQDVGVPELVAHLLTNDMGSEVYRVPVDPAFVGKSYRDYVIDNLDRKQTVVGLRREEQMILQPGPELTIEKGDHAFIISVDPPKQSGR